MKSISLNNSNLSIEGKGHDPKGNYCIKVKFNSKPKSFNIQTGGNLRNTERIIKGKDLTNLTEQDLLIIEKEVVDYIKKHGSSQQKNTLKTYFKETNTGDVNIFDAPGGGIDWSKNAVAQMITEGEEINACYVYTHTGEKMVSLLSGIKNLKVTLDKIENRLGVKITNFNTFTISDVKKGEIKLVTTSNPEINIIIYKDKLLKSFLNSLFRKLDNKFDNHFNLKGNIPDQYIMKEQKEIKIGDSIEFKHKLSTKPLKGKYKFGDGDWIVIDCNKDGMFTINKHDKSIKLLTEGVLKVSDAIKLIENKTGKKVIFENSSKYPELDKIAKKLTHVFVSTINKSTDKVVSKMPYKEQYVLEEVIKNLQELV
jgi:hypothetical protein